MKIKDALSSFSPLETLVFQVSNKEKEFPELPSAVFSAFRKQFATTRRLSPLSISSDISFLGPDCFCLCERDNPGPPPPILEEV